MEVCVILPFCVSFFLLKQLGRSVSPPLIEIANSLGMAVEREKRQHVGLPFLAVWNLASCPRQGLHCASGSKLGLLEQQAFNATGKDHFCKNWRSFTNSSAFASPTEWQDPGEH